ncbi:MAG: ROK family protein [Actinobacteria bacterium]|nr:ROK family protein [Actinomycetota bacterium]
MTADILPDSPQRARARNRRLVLDVVRREGAITRSHLRSIVNLSKTAVKEICDGLVADDLLEEFMPPASERKQGRPALSLRVSGKHGDVLGIDIGADKVIARSATLAGTTIRTRELRTRREKPGREYLLGLVEKAVDAVCEPGRTAAEMFLTVVVSTPGVVDPQTHRVSLAPQIVGWDGIDVQAAVADRLGLVRERVFVERQTDLSIQAESAAGAARGIADLLYVQLGIGIGGALLTNGRLFRGWVGAAGELGYLPHDFGDESPRGSGIGPWEWAAGGRAWARHGRTAALERGGGRLLALADGVAEDVDAEVGFRSVKENDPAALDVFSRLTHRIAVGVASAICVFNPECVLIAGGLSNGGDLLIDALREQITPLVPVMPQIRLAAFGGESCVVGAVHKACQRALDILNPLP